MVGKKTMALIMLSLILFELPAYADSYLIENFETPNRKKFVELYGGYTITMAYKNKEMIKTVSRGGSNFLIMESNANKSISNCVKILTIPHEKSESFLLYPFPYKLNKEGGAIDVVVEFIVNNSYIFLHFLTYTYLNKTNSTVYYQKIYYRYADKVVVLLNKTSTQVPDWGWIKIDADTNNGAFLIHMKGMGTQIIGLKILQTIIYGLYYNQTWQNGKFVFGLDNVILSVTGKIKETGIPLVYLMFSLILIVSSSVIIIKIAKKYRI